MRVIRCIIILGGNMQYIKAIIYDKRGRILSIGENSYIKTHPLQYSLANKVGQPHRIYLHAEVDAIIKCRNMDRAYKMVVMRFNKLNQPVNATPCPICQHLLNQTNLRVEHT